MALFILIALIISNCIVGLLGEESANNPLVQIRPSLGTGGNNVGFYKVEDTLNLTCSFKNETFQPNVNLEWVFPSNSTNLSKKVTTLISNFLVLTIENLQENDSGEYKCIAVHNGIPYFKYGNTVKISVKNKKKDCGDAMFQCSAGICILKRYTCDGKIDCPQGEDESSAYCGPGNPCDNKLMCPGNRCIPYAWCCESHREPNCTTKVKPTCCSHIEKLTRDMDNDMGYQYEQQRFSDMGFLQTTVYTVIGCAMAFMFIVTIIVIAICRVHVRRTLLSRCPAANRNGSSGRGSSVIGNQLNGLSFYDFVHDFYFNRSSLGGSDVMSVNPLMVTYNINNGVQFVGRPVDPPPYCEIVTSPPKEGPPPPYVSHEDLTEKGDKEVEESKLNDHYEISVEAEVTESDALLSSPSQSIHVISSNAMDAVTTAAGGMVSNVRSCNEPENSSCISVDQISIGNGNSSQNEMSPDKSGDYCKNTDVDIVLFGGRETVLSARRQGSFKVQNGESSSYLSGTLSDSSSETLSKIASVKSIDSGSKRRSKSFTKGHFKKY